ncbi:MAG: Inorganic triphosphatase YgiF, contains CYTH and CHAD domains [Chloroflexi bacterium]|jgi:hypothetical protein|nr:MAG: Inorganic triphosphatase YgiF, contains CYTH and CHAD domains [Chloroflexota bacterium]
MPKDLNKDCWPIEQEAVLLIKTELSAFLQKFKSEKLFSPGIQVETPESISLQDTYFDTPSQELGSVQVALRLRKEGGSLLLGVKGRDQWTTSGVSRIEVEEPWCANGVATILHYLDFMGVTLTHPGVPIGSANPVSILGLMDLRPIQDRSLKRTLWPILDNADRIICSLALDVVTLNLSDEQVKYGEIEIELVDGSVSAIKNLFDTLIYNYSEFLQPWRYSKLQTGIAIESLSRSSDGGGIVNENGELTLAGIGQIERFLKKNASIK